VKNDGPGEETGGNLEDPPESLEARLADLRVNGPRPQVHEGPVERDGTTRLAENFSHCGIILIRETIEDGAVEGDFGIDLFPEYFVEMFLKKPIEGDMDLKAFQDVLHHDHPKLHFN